MGAIQLREGIWSVGVLNPALRVFDIVMEAHYGTSYNAYLLTGEKNVLIETVHADYFEEYVENICQVLPLEDVDYLIMNHTEPDHSGSVAKLLELCPKLQIFCSAAGKKHLGDITNRSLPCQAVKTGDTLDLGDKQLEFISAPMLHWADSMFTWSRVDKTLFTCDFLGAHYCEPALLDTKIHDQPAYQREFHNYYKGIFGPFKPFVLDGLAKIPPETELVCPSHGPCLTETLATAMAAYRKLSAPVVCDEKRVGIVYASAYGCTKALMEAAVHALVAQGYTVECCDVTQDSPEDCADIANRCKVVLVGAPTINRDAPKAIWDVLASIDAINTKGRVAGAFGSYGWSGEAVGMLHTRLAQLKFAVPEAPFKVLFTPTEDDLAAMGEYAKSVAALVHP